MSSERLEAHTSVIGHGNHDTENHNLYSHHREISESYLHLSFSVRNKLSGSARVGKRKRKPYIKTGSPGL